MQGRSLVPFVHGKRPKNWRDDFFYEHHTMTNVIPEIEGVRNERWKYVRWVTTSPMFEELFDLKNDPDELHNLIADPRSQKQLTILRNRWKDLSEICK
jgi:arylsulfatase A-like enzyme